MERKKGIQLSQAFGAVLTLVLVAVLVIVAIVIFVSLNTSFAGVSTVTVVNESTSVNVSGNAVAGASTCGFSTATGSEVWVNISGTDYVLPVANWTLALTTGILTNGTIIPVASEYNSAVISYSYTWGSAACDAGEDMTTEFGNYTSLIGLVGTIIFLGLVIGVLVAAFAFGGRRET